MNSASNAVASKKRVRRPESVCRARNTIPSRKVWIEREGHTVNFPRYAILISSTGQAPPKMEPSWFNKRVRCDAAEVVRKLPDGIG